MTTSPPTIHTARGQLHVTRDGESIYLTPAEIPGFVADLLVEADRLEDAL